MKNWSTFSQYLTLLVMAFAIVSCNRQSNPSTAAKTAALKIGFVYVSPVGDGGWTWAHDQGRQALEKLDYVAAVSAIENINEGADATRIITQLAEKGHQLIFTTSFGFMDPTIEVAKRYPQITFMHCSGYKTSSNVGTYFGRIYQARYLTGIVAGKKTKTNIIGYVAAFPIPEVVRGINAFALGVRSVNPAAQVRVVWSNSWYNPSVEKQAAESLLDLKADVIAQHQDSSAPQQAAQDRGCYSIGYNSNMEGFAPKAHLVAAVWNWSKLYVPLTQAVRDKTWKSEAIWWGIETGLVGISPINKSLVSQDIIDLVEQKRQEIIAKKLVVFTGPISDANGALKVPENTVPSDDDLLKMNYFVQGVIGSLEK